MRCSMNCTKELLKSGSYVRSDKVKLELLKLGLTYSFDISAAKYSSQTNAAAEERQMKLSNEGTRHGISIFSIKLLLGVSAGLVQPMIPCFLCY